MELSLSYLISHAILSLTQTVDLKARFKEACNNYRQFNGIKGSNSQQRRTRTNLIRLCFFILLCIFTYNIKPNSALPATKEARVIASSWLPFHGC
jgi:hypothetical protein